MENIKTIMEIRKKIKFFTAIAPQENKMYKIYMADCSKLLQIDIQLCNIENNDWSEEQVSSEILLKLLEDVDSIIEKYVKLSELPSTEDLAI